jgi:hypothetical protein
MEGHLYFSIDQLIEKVGETERIEVKFRELLNH